MDNTLKPIEAFVQQGLAQRFQQLFGLPLVYSNAPDKRATAAKLLQRGLKYPFAFASVSRESITEGSYKPHGLWRRGLVTGSGQSDVDTYRLNVIPTTIEYEITLMTQSFAELSRFKKLWLLGSIQNGLKFSVLYGTVSIDVHVVQERQVNIPQREGGLTEVKEYIATVNLTVQSYMSQDELAKAKAIIEVQESITIESAIEDTVLTRDMLPVPLFGMSGGTSGASIDVPPVNQTDGYLDISLPVDTFNIILFEDRFIGFKNTGGIKNKRFVVRVTQGAPGGFVINWDTPETMRFGDDIMDAPLTPDVGKFDYLGFIYRQESGVCDLVAFSRGYTA
jgi:hypothetical protein